MLLFNHQIIILSNKLFIILYFINIILLYQLKYFYYKNFKLINFLFQY